jgi:hypothetical protein
MSQAPVELDSELWADLHRASELDPCRELWLYVMEDAVLTAQGKRKQAKASDVVEARRWIEDDHSREVFSFNAICALFEVDPDFVRARIRYGKQEKNQTGGKIYGLAAGYTTKAVNSTVAATASQRRGGITRRRDSKCHAKPCGANRRLGELHSQAGRSAAARSYAATSDNGERRESANCAMRVSKRHSQLDREGHGLKTNRRRSLQSAGTLNQERGKFMPRGKKTEPALDAAVVAKRLAEIREELSGVSSLDQVADAVAKLQQLEAKIRAGL